MLRRRRLAVISAAAVLLVAIAAAFAVALFARGGARTVSTPLVHENTLVRIDPKTNAVSDVIDVGSQPSAVAVAGRSVWVYNRYDHTVTEIDARTTEVRQTAAVSAAPVDLGLLTGPVLAADARGAWLVGVDERGRSGLVRVLARGGGTRKYLLDHEPRAVAVGENAVWVLARGTREHQVLRIDPPTGEVTARTRFRASPGIDSLDVGLGAVWVVSSSSAVLYRIDPRSAAKTGQIDLGQRAGRPNVRFGAVWVGVSDYGLGTLVVDPRRLGFTALGCCPLSGGYDTATGYGSIWYFDRSTGAVVR
jgi:YVTN family beta-propeller protein